MRLKPTSEEMREQFNRLSHEEESQFYWDHYYGYREDRIINHIPDDWIETDTRDQYYLSCDLIGLTSDR